MRVQPETRYAKSGDINIAYQVLGEGPPDLVAVEVISHIELDWEDSSENRFFTRLASICRLVRINQRGTGMSDRDVGAPTLETRMDDIRAVLDAVGSERAALFGLGDASPLSVLFAATYPERTSGLILMNSSPRFVRSPNLPWLPTREETQRRAAEAERRWGETSFAYKLIGTNNPSATDEELRRLLRHLPSAGAIGVLPTARDLRGRGLGFRRWRHRDLSRVGRGVALRPGAARQAAAERSLDLAPLVDVLVGNEGDRLALAAHSAGPADAVGEQLR